MTAAPEQQAGNGRGRTVFAAFYTADPPTGGASAVTFHLARHWLGERLIVQLGADGGRRAIAPGLEVLTLRQAGGGERLRKLVQVPRWIAAMAAAATEFRPETVVLEGASWSVYHWLLIRRIRRALPQARIVYHAHNVEYDLRRQKHARAIVELTRFAEARIVAAADVVTAVSDVDAGRFAQLYRRVPLVLPNGVDLELLRSVAPDAVPTIRIRYGLTDRTVLFMGAYAYRPNGEAIDFLVKQVFPAVVARVPAARLLILGGEVPYDRSWLIAPGLIPAENLPAAIASAAVSVAPIFSGSGTRLKIIESLAAGVPVVATAKGAEGLTLREGEGFTRAETAEQFIAGLCRILSETPEDREKADPAAVAAFDWKTIVSSIHQSICRSGGQHG